MGQQKSISELVEELELLHARLSETTSETLDDTEDDTKSDDESNS